MSNESHTSSDRRARLTEILFIFLAFLGIALFLQQLSGAYRADLAGEDEAAHYVTGVMVRTYLTSGDWLHPMQFARAYYADYPKVAIGHWPPVFYLVQALWTLIFSISRESILMLLACSAAACGTVTYRLFLGVIGRIPAFLVGALFLCVPVVQYLISSVMAEMLIVVWSMLALRSYVRYLDSGGMRDSFLFALFAAAAILTKVNGFALAFVPPIAVLLTWRLRLLAKPSFWLPPFLIAGVCGPWYYFTLQTASKGWQGSPSAKFLMKSVASYNFGAFENQLGAAVVVFAILGLHRAVFDRLLRRQAVLPVWAVSFALVVGILIFHSFIAPVRENRHLIGALLLANAFAANGVLWVASLVPVPSRLRTSTAAVLGALVVGLFAAQRFRVSHKPTFGADKVAALLSEQSNASRNVLVSSPTAVGEGAVIAESAMLAPMPHRKIVRASKSLSSDTWDSRAYRLLVQSPEQIVSTLSQQGITMLIWQDPSGSKVVPAHHWKVAEALRQTPERFRCIRKASVKNGFDVYEVVSPVAP